jgi:hypothetical protein
MHFLRSLELHMFERIAQRCFVSSEEQTSKSASLYALGFYLTLVLGAAKLLSTAKMLQPFPPPLPIWAFKLDHEDWPDRGYGMCFLFHTKELWVRELPDACTKVQAAVASDCISVVCDRSTFIGSERMLHWDVADVDPQTEDICATMVCAKKGIAKKLTQELAATLGCVQSQEMPGSPRPSEAGTLAMSPAAKDANHIIPQGNLAAKKQIWEKPLFPDKPGPQDASISISCGKSSLAEATPEDSAWENATPQKTVLQDNAPSENDELAKLLDGTMTMRNWIDGAETPECVYVRSSATMPLEPRSAWCEVESWFRCCCTKWGLSR